MADRSQATSSLDDGSTKVTQRPRRATMTEVLPHDQKRFHEMIDALPAAIYTTDAGGRITHFNPACIAFSGRTPELGSDHWCVTWKLFHPDGRPMPHEECPMAVTLKTGESVRGAEAIAERPDGTRIWFQPYPTPFFDDAGNIIGGINMLVDITERKQAETRTSADAAALSKLNELSSRLWQMRRLSEGLDEMLAATIDLLSADLGYIQIMDDAKGVLLIVAQRGFKPDILKFFREVAAEDDSACGRALRNGERVIIEDIETDEPRAPMRRIARSAGYRAVQSTPLVGRHGRRLGMISTHFRAVHRPSEHELRLLDLYARQAADFIERCKTDELLRHSERELSDFFDNACVALHWVGRDGTILRVNQAELDMLGYRREEYVGRHIADFYVDQTVIDDILARLMRGETLREYAARLRCKDGTIRDVLIDSSVLVENGEFVHTRCFTTDITERKRAEQALRESEERYRQTLALMPAAVYSCDGSGAITYYNQRAAELWGRAPQIGVAEERFCGSEQLFLPDGTLLPHDQCPMAIALRDGQAFRNAEVNIRRPDGSLVTVVVNIDPIRDGNGKVIAAINAFHDVSAIKRAEEALRRSHAELQSHAAELARFNRAAVGRELRMIELKKEIDELCVRLGEAPRYRLQSEYQLQAPHA